jgi:hypothetical protein
MKKLGILADKTDMRALSIRQPYAELILRGPAVSRTKPTEFRSRPTKIIGERFYVYASREWAAGKLYLAGCGKPEFRNPNSESNPNDEIPISKRARLADNIEVPGANAVEPWMLELANMLILKDLPTGVIVGSAVIEEVTRGSKYFEWHLGGIERATKLRKPKGHPQPVWFTPF